MFVSILKGCPLSLLNRLEKSGRELGIKLLPYFRVPPEKLMSLLPKKPPISTSSIPPSRFIFAVEGNAFPELAKTSTLDLV